MQRREKFGMKPSFASNATITIKRINQCEIDLTICLDKNNGLHLRGPKGDLCETNK